MPEPDLQVSITIPVQWGEMDAYGHVNNTVFFRYFESARMAFLERIGFVETHRVDRIGAILHSTSARFRQPLYYPDTVEISAGATEVGEDRFTMIYRVTSQARGVVVAEGTGIIVSFDYGAGKKAPLPPSVREGLARLMSP